MPGRSGGVEISQLDRALDEVFDQAVVYHAHTDYMRDYEVVLYATADLNRSGVRVRAGG
ncbi:hypothetical protein [Micromonospora sp. WMMD998]|uniref:YxiG-like protein n=1 Tax=Micromonospora sp. WMMD998 TaxID=3016092 RepID=UPI00249C3D97|nr:hypothetical protein [Micromonospora sp. WMMD998]WFE38084.1 hypothetical protein O7619_06415 [Micromonospora sp. WMMD998]